MARPRNLVASGFGLSHVGRVRQRNEDTIFVDPKGRFALVADGMGGHHGGQEASRMTCEAMRSILAVQHEALFLWADDEVRHFLKSTFQSISNEIHETGLREPSLTNMGTTLVTWLLLGNQIYVAHVGDSRAYVIRDGMIFQVTMDHTFVNEQINLGAVRSQLPPFALQHAIFRNIGMAPPSDPAVMMAEAQPGDLWLLCSDGLSGKLSNDEMLAFVTNGLANEKDPDKLAEICKSLVQCAIEYGGEDNISVVLMQVRAKEESSASVVP